MKRNGTVTVWVTVVAALMAGVVALYVYDVAANGTPYTQYLFRMLAVVCVLAGTLVRLLNGTGRKSLAVYERAYEEELGYAFQNQPLWRKKLLCACRLYNESRYEKALKYLFDLLQKAEFERDAVPVLLFIALCYTDAGAPAEAIRAYQELLKADQNHALAHSNLGLLFMAEGDFAAARRHYDASIALLPENYYAYLNRANCLFRTGDYDGAIADAEAALTHKNNGAEAASLLTVLYALRGDEENKKKYYHLALTAGRSPEELNESIRHFLSEQNIPTGETAE